jgi:hypothetical protein
MHHADLDPHHQTELYAVLDALPLTPEQVTVIGLSALQSVDLFTTVFEELVAD